MTSILKWSDSRAWTTHEAHRRQMYRSAAARRSAGNRTGMPVLDAALDSGAIEIADTLIGAPAPVAVTATRRAALPEIAVEADVDEGGDYLLVVRYPSGALRFVAPEKRQNQPAPPKRGGKKAALAATVPVTLRFRAPEPVPAARSERRGLFDGIADSVTAVLLKIKDGASWIGEQTLIAAERAIWALLGRSEGLKNVTLQTLLENRLKPVKPTAPPPGKRALLLLHGTFSATGSAFKDLATQPAFQDLAATYGEAIYGFDHLSVSQSPFENVRDLLNALPDTPTTYDLITHSRGGLVLRTLVEQRDQFGTEADRFVLGKAVLVACPNEGTPLATPLNSFAMANWFANVLNISGGNAEDAGFVTRFLAWLLKLPMGSQPGLAAMDVNGESIALLQTAPAPPADSYSALVSNYVAKDIATMMVEAGVGLVFSGAHDLVVPTEGGWRVDYNLANIPAARIACFGPGGNLDTTPPVSHIGFFSMPASATFIANTLLGRTTNLENLDPSTILGASERRTLSISTGPMETSVTLSAKAELPNVLRGLQKVTTPEVIDFVTSGAKKKEEQPADQQVRIADPSELPHQLDLLIVTSGGREDGTRTNDPRTAPMLIATYRGARVAEPMNAVSWHKLIMFHRSLKAYVRAERGPLLPDELRQNGDLLFEALFPASIRRLLDVARTSGKPTDGRLVTTLTSMTPWIADFPWEFARDPDRDAYYAMDDSHLLRCVMTSNPIERLAPSRTKLRVLLTMAEPSMLPLPMASVEKEKIIATLSSAELSPILDVVPMLKATPERLQRALSTSRFDVVHFIGHGYAEGGRYGLVFLDESGGPREVGGEDLKRILSGRGLRLAFLNACETGAGVEDGSASAATGTAQTLFGRGVPVIIANQLQVGDTAAANFAIRFYEYIADGLTIADAKREARIAASYAVGRDNIDWAVPIVFARDAGGALVERKGER